MNTVEGECCDVPCDGGAMALVYSAFILSSVALLVDVTSLTPSKSPCTKLPPLAVVPMVIMLQRCRHDRLVSVYYFHCFLTAGT